MAVQRDKVIASAEKLVAKGKIEPAIKEYERLLEDNPNDVNTLNRIGDLWVRISRSDEAVKVFVKIAEHYSRDGFFLKAIAIFKKINKLDPSKLDIYAKLADLYAKQGLAMEAKSQYQVLADYYLKHGDPANALGIYRKISELDPNAINVHVKLADLYSQNNQTAEALKEYDRVGRMLLKRGMLEEAVQVFKKALKIDAKNTELVDSLVVALLEAKDFENATQIVDAALEANSGNAKLLATLGRIQLAKGDINTARATLQRGFDADPSDNSVRELMAELALKQNDADRALEMLTPLIERALTRAERGIAVEMLNRILRVDSGHTPTLERLVAVYVRLNEETNILASMNSLAEAHIARSQYEQAAGVLDKLIQREPQNSQHRTKLQFVRSQMDGLDTLPARPRTSVPLEIDEPVPSFDTSSDDGLSLDLDDSPGMDLDFSVDIPAFAPAPPAPVSLKPAVEIAAEEANDDLDFITEHLTEAEVFAKYGLAEKATEHLRAILGRAPKNITAHERLFKILLDEGDVPGARAAAAAYIDILEEKGDSVAVATAKNEFTARGQTYLPPPAPPRAPTVERAMPVVDDADDEISFDLDAQEVEFDLSEPAMEFEDMPVAQEAAPAATDEPQPAPAMELDEPVMELDEPGPLLDPMADFGTDAPLGAETPEPLIDLSSDPDMAFGFDDEAARAAVSEQPSSEESFFGLESFGDVTDEEPAIEEIGEIDFYIEQELFDEARKKVQALFARYPGSADLAARRDRLEAAAAAVAPAPVVTPEPIRPATLSRDEIESELLSAIPDDDDDDFTFDTPAAPPAAAAPAPPPVITASPIEEANLFADEDDFFDLAAELESELNDDDENISLSEEEQSLEEIFKEFKKGVEQQLDSEDYDTHYNLGIAYKEMGLIDEAIGEFQLASKDPKRAVECASMLGLCFLEKGMPQLAIKWYRKGIEMPEILEEEHVGLLYDLGSAYVEVGDTDNAQKAFMEVYGMNTNYRDIVSRIKQLEDARK